MDIAIVRLMLSLKAEPSQSDMSLYKEGLKQADLLTPTGTISAACKVSSRDDVPISDRDMFYKGGFWS
jgi:hypothetical protein